MSNNAHFEPPAHEVFGPQGEHVAALLERAHRLTPVEASALDAVWYAAWDAAWDAARDAAWAAARAATWAAARAAQERQLRLMLDPAHVAAPVVDAAMKKDAHHG